jgi:hypothetical protein
VSVDAERHIPYYTGSGLACVTMLLAQLQLGEHPEKELIDQLGKNYDRDFTHLLPAEEQRLVQDPSVYVELLQSFGASAQVRTDGRASLLKESLDSGRAVIVFLGAKALRWRQSRGSKTAELGYAPVVVTQVGPWRVVFHDPDPQHGSENRSMRRGRHVLFQAGTFESLWSV